MRILCLHGEGSNAHEFKSQTRALREELGLYHLYDFVDGPFSTHGSDVVQVFPSNEHNWYLPNDPSSVRQGLDVLDTLLNQADEYDAILAFSDGASLAATWAAKQQSRSSSTQPLKAMILLSPGLIIDWVTCEYRSTALTSKPRMTSGSRSETIDLQGFPCLIPNEKYGPLVSTPTIISAGLRDFSGLASEMVMDAFNSSALESYMHGGAHEVPQSREDVLQIVSCIEKIFERSGLWNASC